MAPSSTSDAASTPPAAPLTPRERRKQLIQKLEAKRDGRLLISYVTSTRPGYEMMIGDEVLPMFFDCLQAGKDKAKKGVDLFLHSNGGSGTAPWRIVNIIREFTDDFTVIVPHHAYSAGTLIALGANNVIMHRMGFLGPIDPSVANSFNPPSPDNPGQLMPISVEDVSAYFALIKEDVGVQHEDELIQAVSALTNKIHPLALGNVHRSHQQSRMIAKKLLRKHMTEADQDHAIEKIVQNLKSNLFYHGHPINRSEAKTDLGLKVENAAPDLEALIWDLYQEYSNELRLTERYSPLHEWELKQPQGAVPTAPPATITTADIIQQMTQMAQGGLGMGPQGLSPQQMVDLAVAMLPHVSGTAAAPAVLKKVRLEKTKGAYLEALNQANVFLTDLTIERDKITVNGGSQDVIKQEFIWQRWETET